MSEEASTNDPRKKTPPSWTSPKDARENKNAGQYPNYYSHKTRSGHVFMMDDSDGAEHVTVQHRSGSAVQFMPDGAVVYTSHNGQYNIVFGENRMLVTGAYDVVVQGGGSLKIDGDYNITVKGDTNMDVNGDFNISAKNLNQTIRGNVDIQAKNKTEKIEGSSTSQSHGALTMTAKSGVTIASEGDSAVFAAAKQVAVVAQGAELMMKSGGKTSIKAGGDIAMDAPKIWENSGRSDDPSSKFAQTKANQPSPEADTPIDV